MSATRDAGLVRRWARGWLALLTFPPMLLHELLHCLAAAPVADQVALVVQPADLHAESQIWWTGDPPDWLIRGVHLIPHVGGLVVGAAAIYLWLSGALATPTTGGGVLVWAIGGMWWLQVTAPSVADVRGALSGTEADENA